MANGAFKFKDSYGNTVSFISGSGSDISFSGGTLNLSGMSGITLGNLTLSGTTQNATSASHAASYLLTSSFNTYSGNTNTIIGTLATTGSNLFKGDQTFSGSLIPSTNALYDLGDPTHHFRHLYLSSASLYIDGKKVLGSTSQEIQFTTDTGQSFKILEDGSDNITLQSADGNIELKSSGGGDVIMDPTTGVIALKGTTTLYAGNKLLSSDGNAIQVGNSLTVTGSMIVTGYIETQELRTTYISSSILYRSGSTKFGDELGDTHSFTGSLLVSGSISVPGSGLISGSAQLPSGVISGSVQVDVMSTTNIARLATTGSNTFTGTLNGTSAIFNNSLNAYSLTSVNEIKGSAYVELSPNQTTYNSWNIRVGAQAADACYYITAGGVNILTTEGYNNPYTVKLYSNGVQTLTMSNGTSTFSGNLSIQSTNTNRMLNLGASNGAHGYIALYGPSINEGNIYHTSTYGIYMDTNTNLLPIRIDGSKLVVGVTGDVIAGSTGTPEGKIDIKGGALVVDVSNNGYGGFKLDDDSNGDYNVNFRAGRGGTNDGFRWYLNARPGGGGAFSTGNERMRLTNTGLGVGVDNPIGRLHIRSSGISASAPSNGWPVYNAEADTNARRIYVDTAGNDNVATPSYGATAAIELCGYWDSRAVITTQGAGSSSPSDQGQGRGKDLMIKAGTSDNTNGYKGGRLYLNGGIGFQGGFGANGGDILMQVLGGSGNVGINQTQPQSKLDVNGSIKNGGRVYSGNSVIGNIATNLDGSFTRSYLLICDLNDIAGFSLNGFMNAASYTCWNMSSFYIMKNYSSTTCTAGITGQYKAGGCDMNIVDLSYGGGRYIAIGYTSNPEIDVVWTGYRLLHMLNADGSAQVIRQAYVTVNSTLATY
jgi:hypothetical protein